MMQLNTLATALSAALMASTIIAADTACRPTLVTLDEGVSKFGDAWDAEVYLIGCENEPNGLTEADRKLIRSSLRVYFETKDLSLIGRLGSKAVRSELVQRVREAIGRDAVTDVLVVNASRWE